jgi:hypothetical protein
LANLPTQNLSLETPSRPPETTTLTSKTPAHLRYTYTAEFDFRDNTRKMTDAERMALSIHGIVGKRLTYRRSQSASVKIKAQLSGWASLSLCLAWALVYALVCLRRRRPRLSRSASSRPALVPAHRSAFSRSSLIPAYRNFRAKMAYPPGIIQTEKGRHRLHEPLFLFSVTGEQKR